MSVELTTQLFDAFLGQSQGVHSVILPDIYSSGGSKNLWIDKYGRAKRILGYTKQNSSPVTTDTGGSTAICRALFPYRKTSGGSVTRQLLGVFDDGVNEYEIWKSTDDGATWTFLSDLGATAVGQIPDFGQSGDTLIITSGKVAPKKWNGTSLSAASNTQSPTVTSAAGAVGNLNGNFQWKLVVVFTDGTRGYGSLASTSLALQNLAASLTWTASADVTVAGYELYRTSGTGAVYYYVTYIDGRLTAAYTDNTADLAILENRIMEEHGDAPPTSYFCVPYKQRMWYLRTDALPQQGYYSDPGLPDSVLSDNNLAFADATSQGDFITGGIGDFEGQLVVFEEKSIWTVTGTGEVVGNIVDFTRKRTNAQIGSVHHRTVARVPAGSKYVDQNGAVQTTDVATLAFLSPLADIRLFDGDNDIIISDPVKDDLALMNYTQRAKSFCVPDIEHGEIAWVYPSGNNSEPSVAQVWNFRWGVWYAREWGFAHAVQMDAADDASEVVASDTAAGTIYKLWSGNSFNGTSFRAQWMSKTLYGVEVINYKSQPAISKRKRWRWGEFLFQTEQSVTLTLEWLPGNSPDNAAASGSKQFSPATSPLVSADGDAIVSANGDAILVSADSALANVKFRDTAGRYLHGHGIRFRVFDEAQNGSWALEAINLAYQILPGMRRQSGAIE